MTYNHKKIAQKPYSKLLEENSKEYELSNDGSKNYDKMLKDERGSEKTSSDNGSLILEKQLDNNRKNAESKILEKQLNDGTTDLNEFSNSFRNDKGTHPMDYFKEGEKADKKAYNAAKNKKRDKRKMDEIAGEQMIGEKTTIVGNEYKSQLLSNYDSREDFLKKNKAIKKASVDLYDADAYLFAIYKTASDEGRELTEIENKAIEDITNNKVRIIAQSMEGFHEDFLDETYPIEIQGDELEEMSSDMNDMNLEPNGMLDQDMELDQSGELDDVSELDSSSSLNNNDMSSTVNIYQWTEAAKNELNVAGIDQYGEIIDRLVREAKEKFGMDFRQAEELIRDEILS